MRSYPRARAMAETVRELVARILLEEISDPRVDFITITGVELSPDMRYGTVYVTTRETDDAEVALEGLKAATGRVRSLLGSRVRLRYSPEITFKLDPAIEEATRISNAIRREREAGRVPEESVETTEETETGEDV
ncbi:MAG TPA: 30S ribosome-binding factor RbfA [Coriobacteriia bacterium]